MRRTIAKIKQVYVNGSMNSRQVFEQKWNTSYALIPSFSNSDDVLRKGRNTMQEPTRDQWNAPVLNGFLGRDRRDVKENEAFILVGSGNKKTIPRILGETPAR